MKAYISVAIIEDKNVDLVVNSILQTRRMCALNMDIDSSSAIYIFDTTLLGISKKTRRFLNEYFKFGVVLKRIKQAKNQSENIRKNLAIAYSITNFQSQKPGLFDVYIHASQNMIFKNSDLRLLAENARLYNAVSPIIESDEGIEVWSSILDRYGIEYHKLGKAASNYITGKVEESFTLNPKCFALSKRYVDQLKVTGVSLMDPVTYLNDLIFQFSKMKGKIDTSFFVHENLY